MNEEEEEKEKDSEKNAIIKRMSLTKGKMW